jgi:hypothetical protein
MPNTANRGIMTAAAIQPCGEEEEEELGLSFVLVVVLLPSGGVPMVVVVEVEEVQIVWDAAVGYGGGVLSVGTTKISPAC